MNTERSDALASEFLAQNQPFKRTVVEFTGDLPADPGTVFPLLCPTREADWIPGWSCELIYTETGYVEDDCVFRTGTDNYSGPGVWVIIRHEAPRLLELIRVMPNLVLRLRIELAAGPDGTTESAWTLVFTALDETGNAVVEEMESNGEGQAQPVQLLNHYLSTGDRPGAAGHGASGSLWDRLKDKLDH